LSGLTESFEVAESLPQRLCGILFWFFFLGVKSLGGIIVPDVYWEDGSDR
jgi:hypothetical protein